MSDQGQMFIARFNAGDEQAFREVFARYYKPLCGYIYDIIRIEKIASFLFVSARHAALNILSHEAVKQQHLNDYTAETATDDMEETLLIAEFDAKLRHWLDALPAECRKIIDLALDGKKNAEIAEALSLSVQTVKNQKVKGLKLLRELYRRDYALLLLFIRLFMERI